MHLVPAGGGWRSVKDELENEVGLIEYARTVRKRLWLVVAVFVLSVSCAAVISYRATPIYRANALLRIERKTPSIVSIEDVYQIDAGRDEYYETQYKLIKSRRTCSRVLDRLGLTDLRQFEGSSDPVGSFVANLIVEPVPETYLVNVGFESADAEQAARVVNAVIDEYVLAVKQDRRLVSEEAQYRITEQIPILRKKLTDSQDALRGFENEHSALSFQKRREIIYDSLSSLNTQLTEVRQEIARAEARYETVARAATTEDILSLPTVVGNPVIQAYLNQKLALEARKAELAQKYKPESDPFKTIDKKISVVNERILTEAARIAKSIRGQMEEKKSEEKKLQLLYEDQRETAKSFDANMSRYEALRAEVDSNRKLYDEFVQRQKEIRTSMKFDLGTVQVVDRAEVPTRPVSPRKMLNIITAALLALLGGVGLALLLEHLDDSVKNQEDVEKYVKLPLLGVVPSVKANSKDIMEKDLLAHRQPSSTVSEAYRNIRTSLLYTSPNQKSKAYVISSAGPQEGKTTTAVNLSIALAHTGKKVLLVDSDLRKPRIHKTFSVDGSRGLTSCLVGQDKLEDAIVETEIENLYFLPSGPIPPNPAELLDSPVMRELIARMKSMFDCIIFDSPPLVAVTDASVLATLSDGAIQVVWAGNTSRRLVEMGKERVENIGAKMIGVILNNMRVSRGGYYYYYPRYCKYYGSHDGSTTAAPDSSE